MEANTLLHCEKDSGSGQRERVLEFCIGYLPYPNSPQNKRIKHCAKHDHGSMVVANTRCHGEGDASMATWTNFTVYRGTNLGDSKVNRYLTKVMKADR